MNFYYPPDSEIYLLMGRGGRVPEPYAFRWLLPRLLGANPLHWQKVCLWSLVALWPLCAIYGTQQGLGLLPAILAGALLVTLPLWPMMVRTTPVLIDLPAMALALLAAVLPFPFNILVAAAGATVKETVPVWAAIYALDPFLLLGLGAILLSYRFPRSDKHIAPRLRAILRSPTEAALKHHQGHWHDWKVMLWPWSGCLAAVFNPAWHLLLAATLAYAQMFRANDTARLYLCAAPVVAVHAAALPEWSWLAVVLIHIYWRPSEILP